MTREEALNVTKDVHHWLQTDREKEALEILIPELVESDDERVRRWIKKEIEDKYVVEGIVNNKLADEAFGWLEKQKHLYETTKDRFYREGFEEGQLYERQKERSWKPTEEEMGVLYKLCYVSAQISDDDDTELTRLYQDLKRECFNGRSFENMFPKAEKKQKPVKMEVYEVGKGTTVCGQDYKCKKDYQAGNCRYIKDAIYHCGRDGYLTDQNGVSWSCTPEWFKEYIQSNAEWAEEEKNRFVSGQFLQCKLSFDSFKEGEHYWLEYVGDDMYVGRSDNVLDQRFHITPRQLYTLFSQKLEEVQGPPQEEKQVSLNYEPSFNENPSDKEIIEALIHHLNEQDGFLTAINCVSTKAILSWLKKQEEQKPIPANSVGLKEQKPSEWSEFDKGVLEDAICATDILGNDANFNKGNPCLAKAFRVAKDWLKSLPERFNLEPKPAECSKATINGEPIPTENQSVDIPLAEWSEEDETAFGDLMWCIKQAAKSAKDENDMGNIWFAENWVKNRLKSLRPQPKREWSEEDEEMFEAFMHKLEVCDLLTNKEIMWAKLRLKSLYPHPKQEWSEEDEKMRQSIIKDIEFERNYTFATTGKAIEKYDEQINWLKFLSLNLKKRNEDAAKLCSNEWSEEDEKMVKEIEEELWYPGDFPDYPSKEENELYDDCQRRLDWFKNKIKSLKSHWKPSEEQMKALKWWSELPSCSPGLKSLYEDLKKS